MGIDKSYDNDLAMAKAAAPLDEKGLTAVFARLRSIGITDCDDAVPEILRAYLAAAPSPSEMEVVAWRWPAPHTKGGTLHSVTNVEPPCDGWEPLVTLSQAQSALSAMAAERDEAKENATALRGLLEYSEDSIARLQTKWQFQLERADAAESQVLRLTEENEALRKDLAAQIAGHQETARQSTDNLVKANAANARIKEAEDRAAKNWRDFRDLRLEIIGHGPMCRDCADFDGRCQGNGPPCDPDEAAKEKLAEWKAAEVRVKAIDEALSPNSREIAAGSAWDFIRPKLEKIAKEGGFAGTWSNGFRSGWDAAARTTLQKEQAE